MKTAAFLFSALAMLASACGNPDIHGTGGTGGGGAGGGGAGGSAGGGAGGGTNPGTGRDGGFLPPSFPDAGARGGSGGGGGAGGAAGTPGAGDMTCASTSAKGQPVPVDLFIMLDKSGSMLGAKWEAAKKALNAFVQSPSTVGLSVGLGFFPIVDMNNVFMLPLSICTVADYAKPVVGVEVLPAVATRFTSTLAAAMPYGGTPTKPALEGAIQYARTWEMTKGRRIAIALVTDGLPNDCTSTVPNVGTLAQTAAGGGIFTFVVGVGPALESLNMIAVAGGTKKAFLVDDGNADQFIDALKMIQTQASRLACAFAIPPPSMGMLDPDKVNVRFSPTGDPMMATTLTRVANRAACGPMGGWYYDNPMMPTTVNLCDATCQLANSSPSGEVTLQFGCKTKVIE
jgi:hypothetical protein